MRTLNKKLMTLACATCLTVGIGAVACADTVDLGYGMNVETRNGVKASVIDSVSTNPNLRTKEQNVMVNEVNALTAKRLGEHIKEVYHAEVPPFQGKVIDGYNLYQLSGDSALGHHTAWLVNYNVNKDYTINQTYDYNNEKIDLGEDEYVVTYNDLVGLMMSSVTSIIDIISYVLIAFVAISLVVSSIMIGIITYISVLERTKEIGILRSIGASKKDISRVFNAETVIVGFGAGAIGIIVTILLNIPINAIIKAVSGISGVSKLPVAGAIILIAISMLLTVIAGLIPAKVASKKDPVEALRTE